PKGRGPEGLDELRVRVVCGAQLELFGRPVVLVDRAAGSTGQLAGARDDRVQHCLEIERRAKGLTDLAQCGQLPDRAGQLGRSGLQLFEQADVFDRDYSLVGEGLEQGDLLVSEWPDFYLVEDDDAQNVVASGQGTSDLRLDT